jgi:hypothetical protein
LGETNYGLAIRAGGRQLTWPQGNIDDDAMVEDNPLLGNVIRYRVYRKRAVLSKSSFEFDTLVF